MQSILIILLCLPTISVVAATNVIESLSKEKHLPAWLIQSFDCVLTELAAELEDHHSEFDHVCQSYDEYGDLDMLYFIDDHNNKIPDLSSNGMNIMHNSGRYKLIMTNVMDNNMGSNFITTTPDTEVKIVDLQQQGRRQQRRNLMKTEGVRNVLIVRVSANDREPTNSVQELSDAFFSMEENQQSFKKRYYLCSFGKLDFVPAEGEHINGGVLDVKIDRNITGVSIHGQLLNQISTDARIQLGYSLPGSFDHVVYVVPDGTTYGNGGPTGWMAFAYVGAYLSIFNNGNAMWLSHQVHEIGHNLGLQHSAHGGKSYGDQSGVMGYGYTQHNFPQMCFNAAKSWQLGWYNDKSLDIDLSNGPQGIYLDSFVDYDNVPVGEFVLLKIGTMHAIYNKQKGINSETQEFQDRVTISQMATTDEKSEVVAALSPNDEYQFTNTDGQNIHIKYCATDTENVDNNNIIIDKTKLLVYSDNDNNALSADGDDPCNSFHIYSIKNNMVLQQEEQQTARPIFQPTPRPTGAPTTTAPTGAPTKAFIGEPISQPTSSPTASISPTVSALPTLPFPTSTPTQPQPTSSPTASISPTVSALPTLPFPTSTPTTHIICSSDEMLVEITLKTDNKPTETSWLLKMRSDNNNIDSKPAGFYTESFQEHYYRYCVPDHQLYEFRINDSGSDGIQGEQYGNGYYRLEVNGVIEDEGGDFNQFAIHYFQGICDGDYASLNFKLHTGTNPQFVSWHLSSTDNNNNSDTTAASHLPMSGGPWNDNPLFVGMNMYFLLQDCLPTAKCYTLKLKSEPNDSDDNDYEPSEGGSIEIDYGNTNIGFDTFSDDDEKIYTFGADCGASSSRRRRLRSNQKSDIVL